MATQVRLDPERIAQAGARGELLTAPTGAMSSGLFDAARVALLDWTSSGDYDLAVKAITVDNRDLATP